MTLAKTVFTPEEVTLQDGKKIVLRPLVMTVLKEAMDYIERPEPAEGEEGDDPKIESTADGIDWMTELVRICLKGQIEEDYDLGMSLDTPTAKRIVFVATGIDFDDTNLMMTQAAVAAAQSGKT